MGERTRFRRIRKNPYRDTRLLTGAALVLGSTLVGGLAFTITVREGGRASSSIQSRPTRRTRPSYARPEQRLIVTACPAVPAIRSRSPTSARSASASSCASWRMRSRCSRSSQRSRSSRRSSALMATRYRTLHSGLLHIHQKAHNILHEHQSSSNCIKWCVRAQYSREAFRCFSKASTFLCASSRTHA